MQIRPILSALRRHKVATFLITMEIALACAVLCNACSLIAHRLSAMDVRSGVDENALGIISVQGFDPTQAGDLNARMVAGLSAIAGVQSVHVVTSVPFGPQAGVAGITLDRKNYNSVVEYYMGSPGTPAALGLKLVDGHMPTAEDYQPLPGKAYFPASANVLVTRTLAQRLWPGTSPLGKSFWTGDNRFRVTGVIDHLTVSQYTQYGNQGVDWSVFVPVIGGGQLTGRYLIRAHPGDIERVMAKAREAVGKIAPEVVLDRGNSHTVKHLRERFFRDDRAMAGLLVGVIAALLGVTALGIVGLASFWVAQRRKQIGVRRALGATRGDILRYFQTENFLIVTVGVVLGSALAVAINLALMKTFELPRLPMIYLPIGAVGLWALGQLAVLAPALRASRVPPVVATRSV